MRLTMPIWALATTIKSAPTTASIGRMITGTEVGGTAHTEIGYNSYSYFEWHNWGSGYDEFEIKVVRENSGDGFVKGDEEDATITFTGGEYWALVEPSDGVLPDGYPLPGAPGSDSSGSYWVPVYYDTYVWLGGDIWW